MLAPPSNFWIAKDAAKKRSIASRSLPICGRDSMSAVTGTADGLLLIEDDPAVRFSVASLFAEHHMPVRTVDGRREVNRYFTGKDPRLVILHLGRDNDLNLLREIRSRSDVPIIATADRNDEIDCVVALELGADDYIARPFSVRELMARVRAVLRRQKLDRTAGASDPEGAGFQFGGWRLERRARRLFQPDGSPMPLTKREYVLLVAFLEAPQRPLSRDQLLQATRIHEDVFDRSIDVQVWRLRRKLETDPLAPKIIKTERGVGYLFTPSVERF